MNLQRDPEVTKVILGSISATLAAVNEVIASSGKPISTKALSQGLQYELVKRITSPNIECRMLLSELDIAEGCSTKQKRQKLENTCELKDSQQNNEKTGSKDKIHQKSNIESRVVENASELLENTQHETEIDSQEIINVSESETPIDEDLLALHFAGLIYDVSSDMDFGEHFRISPSTFEAFLQKIGPHLSSSTGHRSYTIKIDYTSKLKLSLLGMTTELSFREIGSRFNMSRSMAHYVFQEFCNGMMKIAPTIVKWPSSEKVKKIRDFYEKEYKIQGIIGVLDSRYFGVHAAQKNTNTLALLQAVVNHEGKFLDVFTACPATKGNEAQMFIISPLHSNLNSLIPDGYFLVTGSNYPFQTKLRTPYQDNGTLMYDEINYNQSHAQIMRNATATFDELTFRFQRLKSMNMTRSDKNSKVIVSACCLHNLLKDSNENNLQNNLAIDESQLNYVIFSEDNLNEVPNQTDFINRIC